MATLTLHISCDSNKFKKRVELSYEINSDNCYDKLIAKIDGKEEILIDYSKELKLNIILIDDFNNDGNLDILLENIKGCKNESNGYSISSQGNSFFMFTTNGKDFFKTEEVGNDWGGIKIEEINNVLHFTIDDMSKRFYNHDDEIPERDNEKVYVLENYSLKLKSTRFIKNIINQQENNKYKVFAKNGLIIRDSPNGNPIDKLDYGEVITIENKTDVEFSFEEENRRIDGYWYQIKKDNRIVYVFSGYLINTNYCSSLFTDWADISIGEEGILFKIHGQYYISYPIKIINKDEVELIWSPSVDCKFHPGLWEDYGADKSPEIGKPFAKYTYKKNKLFVQYYYSDWVNKYANSEIFSNSYELNYHYLNGN